MILLSGAGFILGSASDAKPCLPHTVWPYMEGRILTLTQQTVETR